MPAETFAPALSSITSSFVRIDPAPKQAVQRVRQSGQTQEAEDSACSIKVPQFGQEQRTKINSFDGEQYSIQTDNYQRIL